LVVDGEEFGAVIYGGTQAGGDGGFAVNGIGGEFLGDDGGVFEGLFEGHEFFVVHVFEELGARS
jgi:hypothetical protein